MVLSLLCFVVAYRAHLIMVNMTHRDCQCDI